MLITKLTPGDWLRTTVSKRYGRLERVSKSEAWVYWADTEKLQEIHPNLIVEPDDANDENDDLMVSMDT